LKKNDRIIINLIAILVILVMSIGISDLLSKSFRNKACTASDQPAYVFATINNKGPEEAEEIYESKKDEHRYQSEEHIDFILEDLSLQEISGKKDIIPRIAFIIDDLGYETEVAEKLMDLDFPITLSILPFLKYSNYIAEQGKENNKEIILHMPMEAKNSSVNPGPGAIKSYMSEKEIRQKVHDYFNSVPNTIGMNNHMGSKITENKKIMRFIFEEIKQIDPNLFFIDSKTSQDSQAYDLAREMGLNALERNVFLDNEDDMDYIKGQLLKAKELSMKRGEVIVIGHDKINTYYVLKRMIPEMINEGIEIVFVSSLANSAK